MIRLIINPVILITNKIINVFRLSIVFGTVAPNTSFGTFVSTTAVDSLSKASGSANPLSFVTSVNSTLFVLIP